MLTFPGAKINIGLNITGKRTDGYHNIETLFYPIGLADVLEVVPDQSTRPGTCLIQISGTKLDGNQDDNLVVRAYNLLNQRFGLPSVQVFLHKQIPTGAGLGGGSSDGASMLLLLNDLFKLNLTDGELASIALELGSDCPFFLNPAPSLASGRGELLSPSAVRLKGYHLLLFHPGTGISTADAYRNIAAARAEVPIEDAVKRPVEEWRSLIANQFEPYAFDRIPMIRTIRDKLYEAGASYSSMTGSGSAVFGLFRLMPEIPDDIVSLLIWRDLLS